ncbi:uncharacterized protein PSFLO_01848 [Pseudozyma flocculosa]|uniref:Uncharacterized protein n=1 Tax=Pseudozyma flocculosa TaxID=84751 RepID=A0A5C3EYA0_9BASI|nr:uncharacterized protein PSFLO_01848 [Pseudozyma flocculosa]
MPTRESKSAAATSSSSSSSPRPSSPTTPATHSPDTAATSPSSSTLRPPPSTAWAAKDIVLDPQLPASHLRTEIYNQLQALDEQQDKIAVHLSRLPPLPGSRRAAGIDSDHDEVEEDGYEIVASRPAAAATFGDHVEDEDEEMVMVEDVNVEQRRKRYMADLAAIWRQREQVRTKARMIGVQVDGWGRRGDGLMTLEDDGAAAAAAAMVD